MASDNDVITVKKGDGEENRKHAFSNVAWHENIFWRAAAKINSVA